MTLQLWQRWLSERTMANRQRSLIIKPNTALTCPNLHGHTPIWTNAHPRTPKATHAESKTHMYPCLETTWYSTQSNPSITTGDPWKTTMRHTFLSSNNHLLRQMIVSCSLDYCAARSCPHKSRRTALLSNFIDSSLAQCVHFELHSVITWLRDSALCVWHFFSLISFYEQERI